jgi:hypothetical protein
MKKTVQVHTQHILPLLVGHEAKDAVTGKSGIIDKNKGRFLIKQRIEGLCRSLFVAYVKRQQDAPAAEVFYFAAHSSRGIVIRTVVKPDVKTVAGNPKRNGLAYAFAGSRYQSCT